MIPKLQLVRASPSSETSAFETLPSETSLTYRRLDVGTKVREIDEEAFAQGVSSSKLPLDNHDRLIDEASWLISSSGLPESVAQTWDFIPRFLPRIDISGEVEDLFTREVVYHLAQSIMTKIDEFSILRGVRYGLKVYAFESVEERDLSLIRFELKVPGISGYDRKTLWVQFSHTFRQTFDEFLSSVGKTSRVGRKIRSLRGSLSEGVVS